MITSRSNAQYKKIKKLLASPRFRAQTGLFVVEGERIVSEAPESLLEQVCVSETFAREKIPQGKPLVFSDEVFKSLSDTVNPQGILAIAKQPEYKIENIVGADASGGLHLILDDIRDPGNLGTILRTAEAAGADAVIMSPGCVDIFNPKAIRSTMGSIYRVPFISMELTEAIRILKEGGARVYGLSPGSDLCIGDISYGEKNAFVIGNEAAGISDSVLAACDEKIKIPMAGRVESLNAAISAAIVMYGVKNNGKI